jgi:hypothetical protein
MARRVAAITAVVMAITLAGGSASASTWLPEWIDRLLSPAPAATEPAAEMSNKRVEAATDKTAKRKAKGTRHANTAKRTKWGSRTGARERLKREQSLRTSARARAAKQSRATIRSIVAAPASAIKSIPEAVPSRPVLDARIEGGFATSPIESVRIASAEDLNDLDVVADSMQIIRAFGRAREEVSTVGQAEMPPEALPQPEPQQASWLRRFVAALAEWCAAKWAFVFG